MLDDVTREWACGQVEEYARRRSDYVTLADTVQQVLAHVATSLAPHSIVQARAKTIPSFAGKIIRKRAAYPNPVEDLTDLCGGRVIAQTRDQVDAVCTFLEEHFAIDWENSEDAGARLDAAEFGYLSRHYVISFSESECLSQHIPTEVPASVRSMSNPRAEIQVRTFLQHAWADLSHELLYKAGFDVPSAWKREFARLAAMLESSDESISRVQEGLKMYMSSYGTYMDDKQLEAEIDLLRFILEHDAEDADLALRLVALARARGDWNTIREVLGPLEQSGDPRVLLDLGSALCHSSTARPSGDEYRRGLRLIESAIDSGGSASASALVKLAEAMKPIDEAQTADAYRRAFEICPSEPAVLEQYLSYEFRGDTWENVASATRPALEAALSVCRARIDVGIDLPRSYFEAGFFLLLLGCPYDSLREYAKGVHLSTTEFDLERAVSTLGRLAEGTKVVEGLEWARCLLRLGLAVHFPSPQHLEEIRALATQDAPSLRPPITILAGSCSEEESEDILALSNLLVCAFSDYQGTLVGGGTLSGVSGLAGMLGATLDGAHAVGYLPEYIPIHARADDRYHEHRTVPGADFSPLAPLQAWIDIVASGIDARSVRVVGIGGGPISATEYRVAIALGGMVATVAGTGRESALIHQDNNWMAETRLLKLPADAESLRSFLQAPPAALNEGQREALAMAIHEEYLRNRAQEVQTTDPSLMPWSELDESLKRSNLFQADDMFAKLARVGLEAVPVSRVPRLFSFTGNQLEVLAEAEHGRWVFERLLDGWRLGEEKDVKKKVSPYLVAWEDLSEEVKQWDRDAVKAIPEILSRHGFEVRPAGGG